MPSTITHAYFGLDLFERLDANKQILLEPCKEQLKTFAQGPDALFFYNRLSLRRGKKIRMFGHHVQHNKTQAFFINLINSIDERNLYNNPETRAFLYGFIAHYVLDMTIHPFIIYKTGIYQKKDKGTHKYFGGHEQMEAYIDAYFMTVRGKSKPGHFKSHKFCFAQPNLSNDLKSLIDDVFLKTYNKPSVGKFYQNSIKQMKWCYKLLRNDRTGIKKNFYQFLERFHFNIKMSAISFNIKLNKTPYYLNLYKDTWHHPLDINESYNYSFIELYAIALTRAFNIIKEVDKVLMNNEDRNRLKDIFPNLSYATGHDCKLGKGKFFSY